MPKKSVKKQPAKKAPASIPVAMPTKRKSQPSTPMIKRVPTVAVDMTVVPVDLDESKAALPRRRDLPEDKQHDALEADMSMADLVAAATYIMLHEMPKSKGQDRIDWGRRRSALKGEIQRRIKQAVKL